MFKIRCVYCRQPPIKQTQLYRELDQLAMVFLLDDEGNLILLTDAFAFAIGCDPLFSLSLSQVGQGTALLFPCLSTLYSKAKCR